MSKPVQHPARWMQISLVLVFGLIFLATSSSCLFFGGNGSGSDLPGGISDSEKKESQTINTDGGTLIFGEGIQLVVPPNAVRADTEIQVIPIKQAEIVSILEDATFPVQPLSFFQVQPDGLELLQPITVILPVSESAPLEGWPVHIKIDLETGSVEYLPTELVYDPAEGTLEFTLDHFSVHGVGGMPDDDFPNECKDPATACRCGKIYVKSSFHDYIIGDCQSVSDEISVQFLDCPGQPTEKHKVSEMAGDCVGMGALSFHGLVLVEGNEMHMNCGGPIPFIVGDSGSILGGGPMQCTLQENFEGMNLDIFIDEQVSLTGKYDGVMLNFDPPQAENVSGHFKAWSSIGGEEFIIMDMKFDDGQASADVGVFMDMKMMSFTTTTDGGEEYRSQFAFSLPLEDGAVAEISIQEEGAQSIMTITLDLY
jgi:hypothetical protein